MDREAFDRSLVRRLLDHLEHRTTDLADDVMELPADVYSRAHHEREVEVLFRDEPLVFSLSGALPGPETFRTVDMCGTPILLTRDGQGRVRALANVCRHRGVRVADGAGQAKRFTCPFHAWTYDLDGRLSAVPSAGAFEGMRPQGLVELPVAEGYGLIVGRLRPGSVVDIEDYLGPGLADELAMLGFADWEPYGDPHVHQVGANWKVTLDTFRENYHFKVLHRRTLAKYAYGGVLTFDAVRSAPAQLLGPAVHRRAARPSGDRVGRRVAALQLPVLALPQHGPDLRQPARRAVADPPGRGRRVRGRAHDVSPSGPER